MLFRSTCDESRLRLSEYADGAWTGTLASNTLVLKCVLPGTEPERRPEPAVVNEEKLVVNELKVLLETEQKVIRLKATAGARGTVAYEPVEPATLTFSLQNIGDKPVKFNTWNFVTSLVTLNVTGPDKDSVRAEKLAFKLRSAPPEQSDFPVIEPRTAWTLEGPFQFPGVVGSTSFAVLKPGVYRLSFTYTVTPEMLKRTPLAEGCWTGTATSSEIVIRCVVDAEK